MARDFTIQREKLQQVPNLLQQNGVDAWLTFVRETKLSPDPALDLILGLDVTWISAFLVTRENKQVAIVGRYDVETVRRMGGFHEIIGYDNDIFPALITVLTRHDPETIAINYSESDVAADGLSYGLWRVLTRGLGHTIFKHRLVSAEPLIGSLRGRKTHTEIQRIREAIHTTERIFDTITDFVKVGQSEVQIADYIAGQMQRFEVTPSFDALVSAGAESPMGHALPEERYRITPGQLLHIDMGVVQNDYVSDLQRVWYFPLPGENAIPDPVQHAFDAVRGAILAAAEVLQPGVQGWEVDQAARNYITAQGYPEYQHAAGHHIGRTVHDGATVLGPRWERYGKTPEGIVEPGNVFTLELGVHLPEYGQVSLEEDVLVTENGLEWLSTPQTEIWVIE